MIEFWADKPHNKGIYTHAYAHEIVAWYRLSAHVRNLSQFSGISKTLSIVIPEIFAEQNFRG